MGLANLVPGVSGGTMLLAAGVYEGFVTAVAEVTTLRLRLRSLVLLGAIGVAAGLGILLLAGPTKGLVVGHRWVMYSLFIGLTLGGVPLVWRMARPVGPPVLAGAAFGLAVMALMAFVGPAEGGGGGPDYVLLVLAGIGGASAMVLPGISGGYLLLVLGQYVPILSAIDDLKRALGAEGGVDVARLTEAMQVVVPVGVGVVLGVVGVSNLVRWLLTHVRQATLGVLLGLLLGAVLGLWPFQEGVPPVAGDVADGVALTAAEAAAVPAEDWPVDYFRPTPWQVAGALALAVAGLGATLAIDRMGGGGRDEVGGGQDGTDDAREAMAPPGIG